MTDKTTHELLSEMLDVERILNAEQLERHKKFIEAGENLKLGVSSRVMEILDKAERDRKAQMEALKEMVEAAVADIDAMLVKLRENVDTLKGEAGDREKQIKKHPRNGGMAS